MILEQTVQIPILTYHSIDRSNSIISTAPEVFRRQMKFLHENNYSVVSVNDLLESFTGKKATREKTVVLTFDDGFQNFYTTAFSILAEFGFTATVFLVTDFCGRFNDWAGNPPNLPRSQLLSWSEIKELKNYGIEFGAHTRTHPDLTKISNAEMKREISESKEIIEEKLGIRTSHFAYPYGKFDCSVKKTAKNTFRSSCSTNLGKARRTSDLSALERVDVYYLKNHRIFTSLSTKTFDRYLRIRQTMRNLKSTVCGV